MTAAQIRLDRQTGVQLEERVPERIEVLHADSLAKQGDVTAAGEVAVGVAVARLLVFAGEVGPGQIDEADVGTALVCCEQRLPLRRVLAEGIVSAARRLPVGRAQKT